MPLSVGTSLGPYDVIAPLGAGGMGEVYRARDTRLDRDVAIKVVAEHAQGTTASARFDREWRSIARLSHPNVVALYDVGRQGDLTYAVTELVPGTTLRQRLDTGPLPAHKAVEIAIQLARGLAAAHAAGLVHRDLKPENVIVTPDGHAKILDFGLARDQDAVGAGTPLESTTTLAITEAGLVLGTRGYMAPEQVRGEPLDHRADVFAFGALLYEILTGTRAFTGPTAVDVLHAIMSGEPDATRLVGAHPSLRRIISRCLEKRREERFASAHDLAYALEAAGDALGTTASHAVHDRDVRWGRAAALSAGIMLVLLAGYGIGRRMAPASPDPDTAPASPPWRAQVEAPPGTLSQMVFSPDGRSLAAISHAQYGIADIWVREGDGPAWKRVATARVNEQDWCAWSPDGKSILYPTVADGHVRLETVDLRTGAIRTLVVDPRAATGEPPIIAGTRVGGSWGSSGDILIGGGQLGLLSPTTGVVQDALARDAAVVWQRWPSFLPDGRSFVFTQESADPSKRGIFLGHLGSNRAVRLVPAIGNAVVTRTGYLLYASAGQLMAARFDGRTGAVDADARSLVSNLPLVEDYAWFSVSSAGSMVFQQPQPAVARAEIREFDRTGAVTRVLGRPDTYVQIALSPDERRLLTLNDRSVLELLPMSGGPSMSFVEKVADTAFGSPAWSPDGKHIAATRYSGRDQRDLVRIDVATGEVDLLNRLNTARWPQAWSRDGTEIVTVRWEPGGASSLWAVRVDDPQVERRLSPDRTMTIGVATLSPDDRWVAYDADENGSREVYVQPFRGSGDRRRISSRGGTSPAWGDGGRELLYVEPNGTVMAARLGPAMEARLPLELFTIGSAPIAGVGRLAVVQGGKRLLLVVPLDAPPPSAVAVLTNWESTLVR